MFNYELTPRDMNFHIDGLMVSSDGGVRVVDGKTYHQSETRETVSTLRIFTDGNKMVGRVGIPLTNQENVGAATISRLIVGKQKSPDNFTPLFNMISRKVLDVVLTQLGEFLPPQPFLQWSDLSNRDVQERYLRTFLTNKPDHYIDSIIADLAYFTDKQDEHQSKKQHVGSVFIKKEPSSNIKGPRAITTMSPFEKVHWSVIVMLQKLIYHTPLMKSLAVKGLSKTDVGVVMQFLNIKAEHEHEGVMFSDDWSKFEQMVAWLKESESIVISGVARFMGFEHFADSFPRDNTKPRIIKAHDMIFKMLCRASGTYHTALGNQIVNLLIKLACRFVNALSDINSKYYIPNACSLFSNDTHIKSIEELFSQWFDEHLAPEVVAYRLDDAALRGKNQSRVSVLANFQGDDVLSNFLNPILSNKSGIIMEGDDGGAPGEDPTSTVEATRIVKSVAGATSDKVRVVTGALENSGLSFLQEIHVHCNYQSSLAPGESKLTDFVKAIYKMVNVDHVGPKLSTRWALLRMKALCYLLTSAKESGSVEPCVFNLARRIGQLTANLTISSKMAKNLVIPYQASEQYGLEDLRQRANKRCSFIRHPRSGNKYFVDWERAVMHTTTGPTRQSVETMVVWSQMIDSWRPGELIPWPEEWKTNDFFQGQMAHDCLNHKVKLSCDDQLTPAWEPILRTTQRIAGTSKALKERQLPYEARTDDKPLPNDMVVTFG
jgi:hypothetical protein